MVEELKAEQTRQQAQQAQQEQQAQASQRLSCLEISTKKRGWTLLKPTQISLNLLTIIFLPMFVGPKICRCAPILLNLYLMAVNHEQAARASFSWEAGDGSLGGRYGFVRKRGYLQVPRLRAKMINHWNLVSPILDKPIT